MPLRAITCSCGKTFESKHPKALYCSNRCSQRAADKRYALRLLNQTPWLPGAPPPPVVSPEEAHARIEDHALFMKMNPEPEASLTPKVDPWEAVVEELRTLGPQAAPAEVPSDKLAERVEHALADPAGDDDPFGFSYVPPPKNHYTPWDRR